MDAVQDDANFELEISLDFGSENNEFEEIPDNYEEDNELTNFVSNLQRKDIDFSEEMNIFVPAQSVADDTEMQSDQPQRQKKSKNQNKTQGFEEKNDEELDAFATNSVKDSTHKQTVWAIRIIKGTSNFFVFFYQYM